MINYGMSITKFGKNVLSDTDPLSYVFTSKFNTLKIWKVIERPITVPTSGIGHAFYTHGFGYKPAYLAYYQLDSDRSNNWFVDRTAIGSSLGNNTLDRRASTTVNSDTIDFSIEDANGEGGYLARVICFIFVDPIQNIFPTTNGIGKNNDYGIKVSAPGIDVTKAKTHELFISSKYPGLKFHMDKTVRLTIAAGGTYGSIKFEHGLGYPPAVIGMVEDFNNTTLHDSIPFGRVPQPAAESIESDKDFITVYVTTIVSGSDITYTMKVIVFKDKISVN